MQPFATDSAVLLKEPHAASAASTSKAFRATLPGALQEAALARLQAWARDSCSRSAMWRQDEGVVWVCTREKRRKKLSPAAHISEKNKILTSLEVPSLAFYQLAGDCQVAYCGLLHLGRQE